MAGCSKRRGWRWPCACERAWGCNGAGAEGGAAAVGGGGGGDDAAGADGGAGTVVISPQVMAAEWSLGQPDAYARRRRSPTGASSVARLVQYVKQRRRPL